MQDGKHKLANNRKSSIIARRKYNVKNYDFISVRVPIGEKEQIKQAAKRFGYTSLNAFVVDCIKRAIKKRRENHNE